MQGNPQLAASDWNEIFTATAAALQPFARPGQTLAPDTDIMADLEIDSVTVLDVVMELEDKFDISVPLELVPKIKTIGDLTTQIQAIRSGEI